MPIRVIIPTPLRPLAGNAAEAEVDAASVSELMQNLTRQFPPLKHSLVAEDGTVRKFVNIYVNGEDIRYTGGLRTTLSNNDVVRIIPSIAGG